ncbi:hypothetical protein [Methylobacterium oxalidis]|uniref:Uncharacterized protein n=1 Tax=Methylobacterium oxalidis TaxID=944322 RepID=A0A512J877_9HYPH|nr:hypothetical protein [Methylobacterium oxalidis]GEP06133.1 hypothetical protein MOX02_41710 [Methylobacterium oxalidis]GJE34602.1 hypothetical protein LDDCCGHA_4814 [Methylobacterium oxalidis]GLS65152.1 hypothetical protein GCM10007888_35340 [Methylobacterium oxalidis]
MRLSTIFVAGASTCLALNVASALAQQGFPPTLTCIIKQRAFEVAGWIVTTRDKGSYVVDFRRGEIRQRLGGAEVRYSYQVSPRSIPGDPAIELLGNDAAMTIIQSSKRATFSLARLNPPNLEAGTCK